MEDLRKAPRPISDFYFHFFFIVFELKKLVPLICQIDGFFEENVCQAADGLLTVRVSSAYSTIARTTIRRTSAPGRRYGAGARGPSSLQPCQSVWRLQSENALNYLLPKVFPRRGLLETKHVLLVALEIDRPRPQE